MVDHGPTVNTSTPFSSIAKVQNLFEEWRKLGSRKLPSGIELITAVPDGDRHIWLHALYPGLSTTELTQMQAELNLQLPGELRAFYRRTAGMSLWNGAFRLYGYRPRGFGLIGESRYADDALRLNHELDVLGWKPPGTFAFAENGWDMSVHIVGMADEREGLVWRCNRLTGEVLETHPSVWICIASRLNRIDKMLI